MEALSHELLGAAAQRLKKLEMSEVFDPNRPSSRPTAFQQQIIDDFGRVRYQYIVAGNRSGKTQLGARTAAWMLAEDKPGWTRPARWGKAPLLMMVIGRTSKQVEDAIYRKIKAFFGEGDLHEMRVGNALQKVTHRKTGNAIIFASHHNVEEAREKVQAFELVGVLLDEMPSSHLLFEELQRRVQDNNGFFITTFTPKTRNPGIKKMVDTVDATLGKKYKLRMLDNPIYTPQDKIDILKSLENMPEAYRQCILEGDWLDDDLQVYSIAGNAVVDPTNYSSGWRHVEGADPALQSKHGQVVFAENPTTNHWYIVRCDYISGIPVPSDLVQAVVAKLQGLNIVRRVCDAASTWYIGEASAKGLTYTTPWDKNNRRAEMMKNLQEALGRTLFIAPWCEEAFVGELASMQWSETAADKVVNSRSYHLHDAAIYAFDCLPKPSEKEAPVPELHVRLRMQMEKDRKAAASVQKAGASKILTHYRIGQRRRW